MKSPAATHEWLKRVSEYQSGGVSEAERAAVEAHLATCQQCQEALAMYQRFYSLLRSPLRLGPPSLHFDEDTGFTDATTRPVARVNAPQSYSSYDSYPPARPPQRSRRSRALAGIAAVLAATIVVAGFLAVYASRGGRPATTPTPAPQATMSVTATATGGPSATATPGANSTPQPGVFVCANAPGSNLSYAYVRGDNQTYVVTGCATPQQIPVSAQNSAPLGWSPTNRYLAVSACDDNNNCPVVLYNPNSGQTLHTKFIGSYPFAYPGQIPDGQIFRLFLGWVDDNTFLGALQPATTNNPNGPPLGTSTIVKVNVDNGAETSVGKIAWFAGTRIIGPDYLFYAGLKTMNEGQAHLHRLDLRSGADTQLVALGEYGNGGCQVTIFCNWTAPWDVSPDGARVLYHNPGPTSFPSDTGPVKDTPLVYANVDGTNASRPFGDRLADTLTTPVFSPDGRYFLAVYPTNGSPSSPPQIGLAQVGGSVAMVDGRFDAWRGDGRAMVIEAGDPLKVSLYDIASRSTTPLEPNSMFYLWGN